MSLLRIAALIALFLSCSVVYAQPGGKSGGGPGGAGRERPAIGVIKGRVIDDATGEPMEFVSITLESLRDSSYFGGITDRKGYFNIAQIKVGGYRVSFNFMGYEQQVVSPIKLSPRESIEHDFGVIRMKSSISELGVAEIVDEKRFMEVQLDKKVYNVGENLTTDGGSASEVLENIPSVEVDIDGQISLRGSSNVTVLIDGKPSGLTGGSRQALLDQIPADLIESIEVITNPSAKYDPDGMAGIINVVLKKNKLEGIYGNVNLSAGTGDNYSGSIGLNYKNQKFSLATGYSYRFSDRFSENNTTRDNFLEIDPSHLDQVTNGNRIGASHTIKLGGEWFLTPSKTLSASGNYSLRDNDNISNTEYLLITPEGSFLERYDRQSDRLDLRRSYDINLGYRQEFGSRKHFLKADAFFTHYAGDSNSDFDQIWFDEDGQSLERAFDPEINLTDNFTDVFTFQTDYERPLENEGRFEAGLKGIHRQMGTDFFAGFVGDDGLVEPDLTRNNNFEYNEQIYSAYSTYGRRFGNWGLQAGGRLEQVLTASTLVNTDTTFNNNYLSFFPSGNLSYHFNKDQIAQFSYSRRINRPHSRQLNPFPNYTDPLNLRMGNPFLLPEYTNSLELGWTQYIDKSTLSASVYYKDVSNVIRRLKEVDEAGVSTTTYGNIAGAQSYGLELIAALKLAKWWNVNASANAFRTISDGSNLESDLSADATSWSLRGSNTFKWGEGWELQITGFYRAPMEILQGEFGSIFFMDAALKKSILDGKGSLSIRARDMFNTREFEFTTSADTFYQSGYRKRESQNFYLNFSYRFGKLEERGSRGRRGSGGSGGDDGGGGMEID